MWKKLESLVPARPTVKPSSEKSYKKQAGVFGEEEAARYLKRAGYILLERNYHTRAGEIDIIARDGQELVFAEVPAGDSHGHGGLTRRNNHAHPRMSAAPHCSSSCINKETHQEAGDK